MLPISLKLQYKNKRISGHNTNAKMPLPKPLKQTVTPNLNPERKGQWNFRHWQFVHGIQTGYHTNCE